MSKTKVICTIGPACENEEMLTDFERIGDHALNIANEMLKMAMIEK